MTDKALKLLQDAMELSPEERAELAAELLGTLPDDGLHPDWSAELTRRALRARQDPGGGEPWETVEKRLRSRRPNG